MKILVFDLETRLLAQDLHPDDIDAGWEALRRGEGGISALMIYDVEDDWLHIYDDQSILPATMHLESADLLIGFRSEAFDIPVIEGVIDRKLRIKQHYDIYAEVARSNAKKGVVGRKGDFTLDAISRRTLGRGKNGSGKHAPALIQSGKFGELFNYCGNDVRLTLDLFRYICQHGGVMNIHNSFLPLPIPDWIRSEMV